ncbi:zincin-like metallopeptidase toxin domain-containing protein [Bacillus cereus group sp. N21]|uniref:zincin-like metallopeptidase toxin domain-containing protein n=1 Tax=Bacillus cereus group sp. N21 TaxID=2794591 RepID=UPI001F5B5A24|nr:zincin-like metallopeptidase toxin domain-containing protein [Bacillus cereus group sp. N21]
MMIVEGNCKRIKLIINLALLEKDEIEKLLLNQVQLLQDSKNITLDHMRLAGLKAEKYGNEKMYQLGPKIDEGVDYVTASFKGVEAAGDGALIGKQGGPGKVTEWVNTRHAESTKFMDGKIQGIEDSLATRIGNAGSGVSKEIDGIKDTDEIAQLDFKSWEEMPVSGQVRIASNGQRLMNVCQLKIFKREMSENNIKVVLDKKENILPSSAAAGFDPQTGQIVLRRKPTYLSALHESYHAKQWRELGKENYLKQSTLEREEYVYNEIMRNKDGFSEAEILFSQRYIHRLRYGVWPSQDWKGFTE